MKELGKEKAKRLYNSAEKRVCGGNIKNIAKNANSQQPKKMDLANIIATTTKGKGSK